jgi:hypothetical protein
MNHTRTKASLRRAIPWSLVLALAVPLLLPAVARAQLSSVANSTTGSTCSGANNADGYCANTVSFTVPSTGTTFTSRHAWNINADVGAGSTRDTSGNAQHNVSFSATAVGGYRLDIATSRLGDMNRNSDIVNCDGAADTSGVTGSSNVALSSGSLSLGDPGGLGNGGSTTSTGINQSSSATIFRVSNGAGQSHTLTFTWNGSVRSNSCEAAVRQGQQNGSTTSCSACEYPGSPGRTQANDGHFVSVSFTSLCGNGTVDGSVSEQCDQGAANGTASSCCTSTCQFKSSSNQCRGSAGVCDPAEFCSGSSATCPADAKSTAVCRGSAGVCDVAESCDGVSNDCPADDFATGGVCRSPAGVCDVAESCDGSGPNCPADAFEPATTVCRSAAGLCDAAETCTGSGAACPADAVQPGGTECRASAGLCDVAEACDGSGIACPADAVQPNGTLCRGTAGACDVAESCDGSSTACPADGFVASGVECRASAGVCDVAESCTGSSAACPTDAFQPSSVECRAAADFCDVAESCTGSSAACPTDAVAPSTVECRPTAGACDAAESCDGVNTACPADVKKPNGTECRASAGVCDVAESCDGVADACPTDAFESASTVCRAATGICDLSETCTGSSATCPTNGFVASGTTCRAAADACDAVEACTGTGAACPTDIVAPSTTVCRPSAGVCDVPETCDGATIACPADLTSPDTDSDTVCDLIDNCDSTVNPSQADGDGDDIGDACDACTGGAAATKRRIALQKVLLPAGDDKLTLKGQVTIPTVPAINPVVNGMRVIVANASNELFDIEIPGGAYVTATKTGWRANPTGTRWVYKNGNPTIANPTQGVTLSTSPRTPGVFKFSVRAKNGAFQTGGGDVPVRGTVVIDSPFAASGQCGEVTFPSAASCGFNPSLSSVTCK